VMDVAAVSLVPLILLALLVAIGLALMSRR
jgi:hypothetical protein